MAINYSNNGGNSGVVGYDIKVGTAPIQYAAGVEQWIGRRIGRVYAFYRNYLQEAAESGSAYAQARADQKFANIQRFWRYRAIADQVITELQDLHLAITNGEVSYFGSPFEIAGDLGIPNNFASPGVPEQYSHFPEANYPPQLEKIIVHYGQASAAGVAAGAAGTVSYEFDADDELLMRLEEGEGANEYSC